MKPKVSIVVPVYNVEKYLDRCIKSLISQTLKEIEIILVDDGSPDNCPTICDTYAIRDKRIKVIHKKNEGLGYARNSGIEIAEGQFIAFIDSDDYVDREMFEDLYCNATKLNSDTVFCGFFRENKKGVILKKVQEVERIEIFEGQAEIKEILLDMIGTEPSCKNDRRKSVSVWHAIYSKKLIFKHKILFCSERKYISEDLVFHIDYLTKANKICYIPNCLMHYISENSSSLTNSYLPDRYKKAKELFLYIRTKLSDLELLDEDSDNRAKRMLIGYTRSAIFHICNQNHENIDLKLREITSDKIWKDILVDYPVQYLPISYKVVVYGIKYKLLTLLRMVSFLKILIDKKNGKP